MAHFQRDVLQKAACTPTEVHHGAVEVVVPCCNSKVQKAYHARLPVLHRWAVICQTNACFSEDGFQCPRHERGNGSNNHCCPQAARNVVFCTLRSCQSFQTVSSSRHNEIASVYILFFTLQAPKSHFSGLSLSCSRYVQKGE